MNKKATVAPVPVSDTPETDKFYSTWNPRRTHKPEAMTPLKLAQKLERERDRLLLKLQSIEFYAATGTLQASFDEIKKIAREAQLPPTPLSMVVTGSPDNNQTFGP